MESSSTVARPAAVAVTSIDVLNTPYAGTVPMSVNPSLAYTQGAPRNDAVKVLEEAQVQLLQSSQALYRDVDLSLPLPDRTANLLFAQWLWRFGTLVSAIGNGMSAQQFRLFWRVYRTHWSGWTQRVDESAVRWMNGVLNKNGHEADLTIVGVHQQLVEFAGNLSASGMVSRDASQYRQYGRMLEETLEELIPGALASVQGTSDEARLTRVFRVKELIKERVEACERDAAQARAQLLLPSAALVRAMQTVVTSGPSDRVLLEKAKADLVAQKAASDLQKTKLQSDAAKALQKASLAEQELSTEKARCEEQKAKLQADAATARREALLAEEALADCNATGGVTTMRSLRERVRLLENERDNADAAKRTAERQAREANERREDCEQEQVQLAANLKQAQGLLREQMITTKQLYDQLKECRSGSLERPAPEALLPSVDFTRSMRELLERAQTPALAPDSLLPSAALVQAMQALRGCAQDREDMAGLRTQLAEQARLRAEQEELRMRELRQFSASSTQSRELQERVLAELRQQLAVASRNLERAKEECASEIKNLTLRHEQALAEQARVVARAQEAQRLAEDAQRNALNEKNQVEDALSTADAQLREADSRLQQQDQQLLTLQQQANDLEEQLRTANEEIESNRSEKQRLQTQIERLERQVQEAQLPSELESAEIARLRRQLEEANAQLASLESLPAAQRERALRMQAQRLLIAQLHRGTTEAQRLLPGDALVQYMQSLRDRF